MRANVNSTTTTTQLSGLAKRNKLVSGTNVNKILELFESLGYECKINSKLAGKSGVRHPFDIIARRGSEIIVADILSLRSSILDTAASDMEIIERIHLAGIQICAKSFDCRAYQSFIIYLSSYLSAYVFGRYDPFELFLNQNHIKIVRSKTIQEAADELQIHLDAAEPNLIS